MRLLLISSSNVHGYGYLDHPEPEIRRLLDGRKRVAFVPFAAHDHAAYTETVRERFDLKRLIQTLTMQGRMSRWIVSALPIGIVLILQVENPHYLHPLLASTAGKVVFGFAAAWAVLGSFAIKRIVEIEV